MLVFVVAALWPVIASAQGGPPLLTDDPDTPGPRHWEINIASLADIGRQERRLDTPRLDINYGVGRRTQLKFEVPWVRLQEGDHPRAADLGTAIAGVKWRFLGQEGRRMAWSIYPQYEFDATSASIAKGIAESGRELLVPTELTVEVAHLEINGEVGRSVAFGREGRWISGLATEASIHRGVELLAELHREQVKGQPPEMFANVGVRPKLTRQVILLLAAGRTLRNSEPGARVYAYAGLQLNLPDQYRFQPGTRPQ